MSEADATLKEAFRHNAWATRVLLEFCARLRPEQLFEPRTVPLAGTRGSILETFHHIVCADGRYLGALTGRYPAWSDEQAASPGLDQLALRAGEAEALWMDFLSLPDDGARKVFLDGGTYETNAAIVVAQALHHGSAHREQICAILREFGLDPPEVQPWDFADATGRSRWIKPA
ncbi:MAG TPA: DinB family protein [Candidatus Dormibacteraeota bacterium]|nr:DinB family protein [Candidatus Dormibacteraeota bacterium]